MKYLCLVYGEERAMSQTDPAHCVAFDEEMRAKEICIASEALLPVESATSVRVRNGRVSVTDGPFAETHEALAGFYLIDARDLNAAIQVAAQIPPARIGTIEIRPVRQLPGRVLGADSRNETGARNA
ncbi:MAG: YciI family protein [Bryobacterales bacterium]|nr:YciI family protein [Bryobacterales bacterium]